MRYELPPGEDYYSLIGCKAKWEKRDFPSLETLRYEWRRKVRELHPDRSNLPHREGETRFRALMEAFEVVGRPSSAAEYQEVGPGGWRRRPYSTSKLPDWRVLLLDDLLAERDDILSQPDAPLCGVRWLEERLTAEPDERGIALPASIPGEVLESLDACNVGPLIAATIERYTELHWLAMHRLTWSWRLERWKKGSKLVIGDAAAVPQTTRDLHPAGPVKAPEGRIRLALGWWLNAAPDERRSLLHHELLHFESVDLFKLRGCAHSIETFPEHVAAHGIETREEALWLAAALKHPATLIRMRVLLGTRGGEQADLFAPRAEEVVAEVDAWLKRHSDDNRPPAH